MRRNSGSFRNSGAYTSPGTPEYGDDNMGELPKSWHSERVPLPTNSSTSRRHVSAAALMPFNGGRALPSKWDDAERWITSPVSGFSNSFAPPQRQPKSKSGPLAPQGLGYVSKYSPMVEGGNVKNFMGNSPLTTGVMVSDGLSIHYDASGITSKKTNSLYAGDNNISRGTNVPGLLDSLSSVMSSHDDKLDGDKEEEARVSRVVSWRDMATQISPHGSTRLSTKERLSFSTLPSALPTSVHPPGNPATKDGIRDVQVDKGTTTAPKNKKQGLKKMKNVEDVPSSWNVNDASKRTSRLQRKEAKITAWENLQKAKAEAAIQKLEMKLEKKRWASMDKIMSKLRAAQMKAEATRNSLLENNALQASTSSSRERISCCAYFKIRPLSNPFPCRRD